MDPFLPALAASLALLPVAAKAHGRQVRLERELEGHHEVSFEGENPPFVTALWRRDRIRFWTVVPLAAVALGALAWTLRAGWGWVLLAVFLWAPTAGFATAGMRSLGSLRRRMQDKEAPEAWRRNAARGSVLWWSAACALALAVALLAWLA